MKIEYEGKTWQLDEKDITNKQAEAIRAHSGLSIQKWFDSLKESDALAWESSFDALYWLMLQQNGGTDLAISQVEYPVYRFLLAYMEAYKAEHPQAAEPDPTQPPAASAPSRVPASRQRSGRGTGGQPDG